MDPNATYDQALAAARRILEAEDVPSRFDAYDLAEAFEDLDEWFRKSGFLPARWAGARVRTPLERRIAREETATVKNWWIKSGGDWYKARGRVNSKGRLEWKMTDGAHGLSCATGRGIKWLERTSNKKPAI